MVFNFERTVLLLFKIWKYSFLPNFILRHEQCLAQKTNTSLIGFVILTLSLLVYSKNVNFNTSINEQISLLEIVAIYAQSFLIIFLSHWKRHEIALMVTRMLQIELSKFTKNFKKFRKSIVAFVIFKISATFVSLIVDFIFFASEDGGIIYFICFYIGYITNTIFDFILFFNLYFLKELKFYFISSIRQQIKMSLKDHYLFFKDFKTNYALLLKLCIEFNKTFQCFILFKFLTDFLLLLCAMYYFIVAFLTLDDFLKLFLLSIADMFWFLNLLGTLYHLSETVHVISEVKHQ